MVSLQFILLILWYFALEEKMKMLLKRVVYLVDWQIRKRDWSEQGQSLKVKINAKLAAYQAAAKLQIRTLASLDLDGKSSKKLLQGALASLIEAAEACLFSVWRKLRACEELFSSLLSGISHAAVARDGQMLRVLLIRFKSLVLAICAQVQYSVTLGHT